MNTKQSGYIIPLVIALVAVLVAGGAYLAYKNEKGQVDEAAQTANQVAELNDQSGTNSNTSVVPSNSSTTSSTTQPAPVITSITPSSGPAGTVVTIKGTGLSGFEGDLNATFVRQDGKKITLTDTSGDYAKTGGSLIKVTVKEPCQQGQTVYGSYSGAPSQCDYVQLTPGTYSVNVSPWGVKSNSLPFGVTSSSVTVSTSKPSITITSPNGGETVKIGSNLTIKWNADRTFPASYKFVISGWGTYIAAVNASATTTAYSYNVVVPEHYVTADILSDMSPGQRKIQVSLYDGVAPLVGGKTCTERVQSGSAMSCNQQELFGNLITSDQSDNYFTITNN